jgi:hypothetical protein
MSETELNKMIAAGIKAVDLYAIARDDVITHTHLKKFLKAALHPKIVCPLEAAAYQAEQDAYKWSGL